MKEIQLETTGAVRPRGRQLTNSIMSVLQNKPCGRSELASVLGIPKSTVERHVRKLVKDGELSEVLMPRRLGSGKWIKFYIFVETKPPERVVFEENRDDPTYQARFCELVYKEVRDNYADSIIFRNAQIIFGGDWDVLLEIDSTAHDVIATFVVSYLRPHDLVARTSTTWSLLVDVE